MRLYTYQHPHVLQVLQNGETYRCGWENIYGVHWQRAFRWMNRRMALRGIEVGSDPPVWAWHSVNRLGGKPDLGCAMGLLSEIQRDLGVDLLELQVPDHEVLLSAYGPWNRILDQFIDGLAVIDHETGDCFSVDLTPRRGRPPHYFDAIQACFPRIEPEWLVQAVRVFEPK